MIPIGKNYLLVILPNNLETKLEDELLTKYDIMSTTVKRKIPLIENIMRKRKQIKEQGKQEANIEAAKKMLKILDVSIEQIAEIQGLPVEVVLELKKEIE